jgi:hypothetical protein
MVGFEDPDRFASPNLVTPLSGRPSQQYLLAGIRGARISDPTHLAETPPD